MKFKGLLYAIVDITVLVSERNFQVILRHLCTSFKCECDESFEELRRKLDFG